MDDPGPPKGWPGLPDWNKKFYAWVKQTRALAGIGLTPNETPNGTMFNANPGGGAIYSPPQTPFQVLDSSSKTELQVSYNSYSYLFNTPNIGDTASIDGLDTDGVSVAVGDWIVLEIDLNQDGTVDGDPSINVETSWPGNVPSSQTVQYTVNTDDDYDPSIPYVDSFYVPVAYITDQSDPTPGTNFETGDGSTKAKIIQLLFTNLIMTQWAIATADYGQLVATVPEPWTGTAGQ